MKKLPCYTQQAKNFLAFLAQIIQTGPNTLNTLEF